MFPDQPDRVYFNGLIKVWDSYSEADKLVSIHPHLGQELSSHQMLAQAKSILDQEFSANAGNYNFTYCIHPSSVEIFELDGMVYGDKSIIIISQNLPEYEKLLEVLKRLLNQELKELDCNSGSYSHRHLSDFPFSMN